MGNRKDLIPVACVAMAYMCAASANIIARSAGDTLFLSSFSRNYLSFMYIGTACVVGPLAYYFGIFTRTKSLNRVQIASCAVLAISAIVIRAALNFPSGAVRIAAYFWADVTVYGSMLLFWTFFAQVFDVRQAKRVVGKIGAAGTTACIIAGFAVKPFVAVFGTPNLLLVVALQMAVLALMIEVSRRFQTKPDTSKSTALPGQVPNLSYYVTLLKSERVRKLALQVILGTAAIIFVDYQFKAGAQANYQGPELAAFFGNFYAVANVVVLVIQLFAVRFLLNGRMLFVSLCILPLGLLLGSTATIFTTAFAAVVATRFISQTTLFTIDTAALQILYLGVKKQSQNQVRSLVDGISKPAAVGITGVALTLLFKAAIVQLFGVITIFLCVFWVFVARRNYRLYVDGLLEGLGTRMLDVSGESALLRSKPVEEYIRTKIQTAPVNEVRYLLDLIQDLDDGDWTTEFRSLLKRPEPPIKVPSMEYLGNHGNISDLQSILAHFHHADSEVRCAAIRAAAKLSAESVVAALTESLRDREPAVQAESASALISANDLGGMLDGISILKDLLDSHDEAALVAIVGPISRLPFRGRTKFLLQLLQDRNVNVRIAALKACCNIREPELLPSILMQSLDPETSEVAGDTMVAFGPLTIEHLRQYPPSSLAETLERSSQLTRDLVRIGGIETLRLLSRALDASSIESPVLLRAYCELFRKIGRSDKSLLSHWDSLFHRKLDSALHTLEAFGGGISLPEAVVLTRALRDEHEAKVQDVFGLLDARFENINMRLLRTYLDSGNNDRRNQALEILENVLPVNVRTNVMKLIEKERPPLDTATANKLICEIVRTPQSEPLLAGALYTAAETGLKEAASSIERLHEGSVPQLDSPAVRETAEYASLKLKGHARGESKMLIVETVVFLQNVPLFSAMATNELIQLAYMTHETTYIAGSTIINEGEPGDHMFIIVDGEIAIHRAGTQLQKLGPKDFFGEMSIIDGEPRSASATALTDCLMLRIDQSDFLQLLWSRNSIAMSVIKTLTHRLRHTVAAYGQS